MPNQQQQQNAPTEEYVHGIQIKHPDTGKMVSRVAFIRERIFGEGKARGAVSKELTKIQGKPVPYQTVYAAIKGDAKAKWEKATGRKAKGDGRVPQDDPPAPTPQPEATQRPAKG